MQAYSSTQVWLGGIPWEGSGPDQDEPVEPALLSSGLKLLHPAHGFPCVWVRGSRTRLYIPQPGASWGVPQCGVGSMGRGRPEDLQPHPGVGAQVRTLGLSLPPSDNSLSRQWEGRCWEDSA